MAGTGNLADHDPVAVARQFGEQVPHSSDLGMEVLAMEADQVRMRLEPGPALHADDAAEELCTSVLYSLCLLYTSPSPRDLSTSRMPSSA